MLEHKILKALLDKDTYSDYRKKVTTVSSGMQPWFDTLDVWYETHQSSITPQELHDLHDSRYPAITSSARALIDITAGLIKEAEANPDVMKELIQTKFNQETYSSFAEQFIKLSEGDTKINLVDIERQLKEFNEGIISEIEFPGFDINPEQLLELAVAQGKWKFNLPVWQEKIGGIGPGVFGLFAARPNAGKSLAAIYSSFGPDGWADQGACITYLGNEEGIHRHIQRAVCSYYGINIADTTRARKADFIDAANEFKKKFIIPEQVRFIHKTGLDYLKIETMIEEHNSDIMLIDQLDKLHVSGDQEGHVRLRKLYTTMRENTANHPVSIIGVSQASDEATGKRWFGFEALEGSKTGKGAELDLCICIGAENLQQDTGARFFYVAKNKLSGWEGTGAYMIDPQKSRMLS